MVLHPAGEMLRESSAVLLRPDGRIERLAAPPRPRTDLGYGSPRPGRDDERSHAAAAQNDRRRSSRRSQRDGTGRILDLTV